MVEPRKQLARKADTQPVAQDDDFELLLTRKPAARRTKGSSARSRFIYYASMFSVGLALSIGCLWTMLNTSEGEEMANNLGLHRVANSLENILSLLAFPVLMFSVILTLYAAQQLHRLYKEVTTVTSSRLSRTK